MVPEPVCANKARNGPATADQGSSPARQGTCHVHGTLGFEFYLTHPFLDLVSGVQAGKLRMREWVELFDEPRSSFEVLAFLGCWPCSSKKN